MKNPQTLAKALYEHFPTKKLKAIKDFACCAFTLLWWLDIDCSDIEAIILVDNLMLHKATDKECTVYWDKCIFDLTGRTLESVEKVQINDISKLKEKTIVKYSNGIHSHWVGVKNGRVVFNSLDYSNCVANGKPTEARILKIKKEV